MTLKQLIEIGKGKGHVLFDDIDELLTEDCEGGPELDEVLSAMESAGIGVLESPGEPDQGGDSDDPVQIYLHVACQAPPLTRGREIELAKLIHSGCAEAEAVTMQLVEANLRLAVSFAKNYAGRGVHVLDLIQEGNNGLLKAAQTFDYSRGYQFSTYAAWWVRHSILRALKTTWSSILIGGYMLI